jgi:hypothetical protein
VLELARLERQTLDMLVRAGKAALDVGVQQRRVEFAEEQGVAIGEAARDALAATDLPPGVQARFAQELVSRLALLTRAPDGDAVGSVTERTR